MSVNYLPLPETWETEVGNKLPPALQKFVIGTAKKSAALTCTILEIKKKLQVLETEIMSSSLPQNIMITASKKFPNNEPQAKKFALILAESNIDSLKLKLDNSETKLTNEYTSMVTITAQTFNNIKVNPNLAAQSVSAFFRHHLNIFVAQFTIKSEQDKLKKAAKLVKLNEKKELDATPKILTTKEYNHLTKNLKGSKQAKVSGSKKPKETSKEKPKDPKLSKDKSKNLKQASTAKGKKK